MGKKKSSVPSSKAIRALRKKTINESEALGAEINELSDELLKAIVENGPPRIEEASVAGERRRFFVPEDIPPLTQGSHYHIKNESGEGVYVLTEIVSGRTTLLVFKGFSTGVKTTYTPASIKDLTEKSNFIKLVSPAEAGRIDRETPHG